MEPDDDDFDDYDDDYEEEEVHEEEAEQENDVGLTLEELREKEEKSKMIVSAVIAELKEERKVEDAILQNVNILAPKTERLKEEKQRNENSSAFSLRQRVMRMKEAIDFRPCQQAHMMKWEKWTSKSESFVPKCAHASVVVQLNGVRPVLLVFGGSEDGRRHFRSVVQMFDPEASEWKYVSVRGAAPITRTGHKMVLDASLDRVLLIGGVSSQGEVLNHVDVLHGVREMKDLRWNEQHEAQPRRAENLAHFVYQTMNVKDWCGCDPNLLYGHESQWKTKDASVRDKLKYYHVPHWQRYLLSHDSIEFPALSHHTAISRGTYIWVFGGQKKDGQCSNDVFSLDLNNFGTEKRSCTDYHFCKDSQGGTRSYAVFNEGRCVVFSLSKVEVSGEIPEPKAAHTASMINPHTMVVIGGLNCVPEEVFVLDCNSRTWSKKIVNGLPALSFHTATAMGRSGRVIVFGGFGSDGMALNKVFIVDCNIWQCSEVNVLGDIPSPRGSHTADLLGEKLYVSSGFGAEFQPSLHVMDHPFDSSGFNSMLGNDLMNSFDHEEHSDVTFIVEGKEIHCHKIILCCRSEEMKALFAEGRDAPNVIDLPDCDYKSFRSMLQYLYQDRISLTMEDAKVLAELSKRYKLTQLQAIAESCFFETAIPPSTLNSDLNWALQNFFLADVIIEVEGVEIPAHRVILMNRSLYFRSMLDSGFREGIEGKVVLPDMELPIFQAILKFMYTDRLELDTQICFDLFCQGAQYQISSLTERCEAVLLENICDETVIILLEAADRYSSVVMKDKCLTYINRYFMRLEEKHTFDPEGVYGLVSEELKEEIQRRGELKKAFLKM